MVLVGLTGGIGSGKSTVASLLGERGAVLIDADAIARRLQRPGTDVFAAIVARFGADVVAPDGTLDRRALAGIVFGGDAEADAARRDLEAIVHPAVAVETARRVEAIAGSNPDAVVVHDIPLLVEVGRAGHDVVLVVDVDPEVAVGRLVERRGFSASDARARVARQASRTARLAAADRVIDNSGSLDDLRVEVDSVWTWLVSSEHRYP